MRIERARRLPLLVAALGIVSVTQDRTGVRGSGVTDSITALLAPTRGEIVRVDSTTVDTCRLGMQVMQGFRVPPVFAPLDTRPWVITVLSRDNRVGVVHDVPSFVRALNDLGGLRAPTPAAYLRLFMCALDLAKVPPRSGIVHDPAELAKTRWMLHDPENGFARVRAPRISRESSQLSLVFFARKWNGVAQHSFTIRGNRIIKYADSVVIADVSPR